jgi:hypothetical protein
VQSQGTVLEDEIRPDDVNTSLNRLGFDSSYGNLLSGDRIEISTTDARGLVCFTSAAWASGVVEPTISAYVNVNAAGGLRFFASFEDAINNTRANELALYAFTGAAIPVTVSVRDSAYNVLGCVIGYTLNTDREAVDVTTLSDKFRRQYSAGLISGSGTIECAFDYQTSGVKETPLLMLQLIQRLDIGSAFDLALYLTDKSVDASVQNVFYEMSAVVTKAGIAVRAGDIIDCTIDFVTTGEIQLLIGEPQGYILQENDDLIILEQSLDYLLQESED